MSYTIKCDRCGEIGDVVFANVDTGYWVAPPTWLTIGVNGHLCPACKARAVEPIVPSGCIYCSRPGVHTHVILFGRAIN